MAPAPLIPADETARRARAAWAYSGLEWPVFVERSGISDATLRRITAKTAPRAASVEELWAIADACGVPRDFMEDGFAAFAELELAQRVDYLEATVEELRAAQGAPAAEQVDRTRRTKQALADVAAARARVTEAAASTRDEADASPGDAQPPGEAKTGSGGPTAR